MQRKDLHAWWEVLAGRLRREDWGGLGGAREEAQTGAKTIIMQTQNYENTYTQIQIYNNKNTDTNTWRLRIHLIKLKASSSELAPVPPTVEGIVQVEVIVRGGLLKSYSCVVWVKFQLWPIMAMMAEAISEVRTVSLVSLTAHFYTQVYRKVFACQDNRYSDDMMICKTAFITEIRLCF